MAVSTWSTTDLSAVTLTGSNLIATATGVGAVRGKDPKRAGKFYFEVTVGTWANANTSVGVARNAAALATVAATPANAFSVIKAGTIRVNTTSSQGSLGALVGGNIIGIAIDLDARLGWMRLAPSGNWNGVAANNPATGIGGIDLSPSGIGGGIDTFPLAAFGATSDAATGNFGGSAFSGAVPSGYTSGWDDSVAAVSYAVATQVAVEEWASAPTVYAKLTQIAVEEWASVTLGPYPTQTDQARAWILA